MKLLWSDTATRDLISIGRYIAEENPGTAKKWADRLRGKVSNILHAPLAGRKVPELGRDDIRELIAGNYRIVYHLYPEGVTILTIFEAHRLFPRKNVL